MITEFLQKIKAYKEVLAALPQNNPKNRKIYKNQVSEIMAQYKINLENIKEEIKRRNQVYLTINESDNIEDINKKIDDIKEKLILFNDNCSTYEISGLDKMLYKLGHFYNDKIDECNLEIKNIINVFKMIGITFDDKTFNYSYYCKLYMDKFLLIDEDDQEFLNKAKLIFDDLYWKCPDIIKHITLSFKYLYYNNQKKFDEYYNKKRNEYKDRDLIGEYTSLIKQLELEQTNSRAYVLKYFLDDNINISNYDKDSINKIVNTISNKEEIPENEVYELKSTLTEYKGYLSLLYIIDDIKKLYVNKNTYKGIYLKKKKEITKKEKHVLRDTKKVFKSIRRNNIDKIDYYNNLINNQLKELNELYKELEHNYFLEKVYLLNETSTIMDLLNLALSNYNYLIELVKNKELDINLELDKLKSIIYKNDINIINNIFIDDEKKLQLIICNKYNLYGYKLNEEMLDINAIDNLIKNCDLLIGYYTLKKHNFDSDKIKFIKESTKIIEI